MPLKPVLRHRVIHECPGHVEKKGAARLIPESGLDIAARMISALVARNAERSRARKRAKLPACIRWPYLFEPLFLLVGLGLYRLSASQLGLNSVESVTITLDARKDLLGLPVFRFREILAPLTLREVDNFLDVITITPDRALKAINLALRVCDYSFNLHSSPNWCRFR